MAYSTIDDIRKLLPEMELLALTDDESLGTVEQGRVDEAIAQADAEIDSYCAVRYSVPVTPVPAMLRKLSVDIAVYALYSRAVQSVTGPRSGSLRAYQRARSPLACKRQRNPQVPGPRRTRPRTKAYLPARAWRDFRSWRLRYWRPAGASPSP